MLYSHRILFNLLFTTLYFCTIRYLYEYTSIPVPQNPHFFTGLLLYCQYEVKREIQFHVDFGNGAMYL